MEVSRSAYYEWLEAKPSQRSSENELISEKIAIVFEANRGIYGRRRIVASINHAQEKKVSINRVARRMNKLKIAGYTPPAFKRTTVPDALLDDSPTLVGKAAVTRPNEIWASDITYIGTSEGWLYLRVIIDLYSRKVVGWSARKDMKVELLLEVFDKAVRTRRLVKPVIFHSDKGGQYKAKKYRRKLLRHGFRQSRTGEDHCFDNAFAESFLGTLKRELIRRKTFDSRASADAAIFEYIEVFYNRTRMHSSLGYQSPEGFERNIA
jgi:transposase InsO family protein